MIVITKVESGKCPKCHSQNLEYGVLEIEDMYTSYPVECKDCGFTGKEWYDLTFTGFTDEKGEDINVI